MKATVFQRKEKAFKDILTMFKAVEYDRNQLLYDLWFSSTDNEKTEIFFCAWNDLWFCPNRKRKQKGLESCSEKRGREIRSSFCIWRKRTLYRRNNREIWYLKERNLPGECLRNASTGHRFVFPFLAKSKTLTHSLRRKTAALIHAPALSPSVGLSVSFSNLFSHGLQRELQETLRQGQSILTYQWRCTLNLSHMCWGTSSTWVERLKAGRFG